MKKREFVAALAAGLSAWRSAEAQLGTAYPVRAIKIMVPSTSGSGPDQLARLLAKELQSVFRQPIVVDNKQGALGALGAAEVARAAPDGYTLLLTTNTTQAAILALVKNLPYDPVKDFVPITRIATGPMMLLVRADSPYTDVLELVRLGHSSEKGISVGYGTAASQISAAKVSAAGKLNVVNIPYKGIPPAVNDLLGGHIDFTFADLTVAIPLVQSGRARGLGVTSLGRLPAEPQIPALAEFFPGLQVIGWQGLMAPSGTPAAIVEKLDEAVRRLLERPDIVERLKTMHLTVAPMSSHQFGEFIGKEIVRWKEDAKQAGIQPE